MFRRVPITHVLLALVLLLCHSSRSRAAAGAAEILKATGVSGGLVVHLGCGNGKLTAALRATDSYVVQGLDTDAANVKAARRHVKSLGLCGKVSADTFDGEHLPYTDNLVNLLVVSGPCRVTKAEMLRVLAPGSVAYIRSEKLVKPRPKNIDEWTHYLHDPGNNAVANDTQVGPPRHMQWLGGPAWTRNHHTLNSISAVVTANGRLFYIVDEATAANMSVPGKWAIVARDAFSGIRLWNKPMPTWAWHRIRFRSGPPQVTRLLVVSGDRLYAPLGLSAPVSAMDAVTGKTLKTYANTQGAEEIIVAGGVLLTLKGNPVAEHAAGHTALKAKFKTPNKKTVIALSAETGEKLWDWSDAQANPMPETLASDGERAYFQVGQSVTCLDLKSGKKLWTFGQPGKTRAAKRVTYGKYTLVVSDGVVLCKLAGQLTAIAAKDGKDAKKLWECKAGGGFHAPLDIFVINGLVWQGLHVRDSVAPPPVDDFDKGRDLRTGEVKRENTIMVDLQTSGHHHRCYREKATSRYIITGKRGVEMMDLQGDNHSRNNWVRGTCQYGMLPANGLIYAPSHSCGCYMESLLWGFWALAPDQPVIRDAKRNVPDAKRLEKGPAYGKISTAAGGGKQSWPQHRHDPRRSGIATTALPAKLKRAWKVDLATKLSQPVAAGGKVLVSAVDANTVYALNEKTGKAVWQYTAGGRVDSPPAIHNGMALFGSADGWVYCLRLSDGELVWRFLAAQANLKTVAFNQVESLWPVHGSVLVLNGVAYCAAGRSTWIDGGIDLYGLDPATGKVVHKSKFASRHPKINEGKDKAKKEHQTRASQNTTDYKTFLAPDRSDSFSMAGGSVADLLVSDGKNVFMHHVKFNPKLERQAKMSRHLFSTSCLLDGAENHRSHWVMGTGDFSMVPVAYSWIANGRGRRGTTMAASFALMMVYDDGALWIVRRRGTSGSYTLSEKPNAPFSDNEESLPDFRKLPKNKVKPARWTTNLPVRPRAMLKAGGNLYLGCMPTQIPGDDPHASYEGRKGGAIWVVSAKDGTKVAEYKLASPAVWDGMSAANGRLFVSTESGELQCWSGN